MLVSYRKSDLMDAINHATFMTVTLYSHKIEFVFEPKGDRKLDPRAIMDFLSENILGNNVVMHDAYRYEWQSYDANGKESAKVAQAIFNLLFGMGMRGFNTDINKLRYQFDDNDLERLKP